MCMKTSIYKLGHIYIQIERPEAMEVPDNIEKFCVDTIGEGDRIQMKYRIEYTSDIVSVEKEFLNQKIQGKSAQRDNLLLFQTEVGECRRLNLQGVNIPYAFTLTKKNGTCHIWVNDQYRDWMKLDTVFVSMLALEKQMIEADAMILHSAYMCYDQTAVLFSAPSETGKSTQADLWEKYRGTWTVNGDRSLLIREDDGWKAYGWPVCGSSEICHNKTFPIRAIVMLKQAKENKVYPLKGIQALREVMEQITINTWDREYQMKAMDQIEQLLQEVPIYRLECDISEDAVRCLEEMIR